MIRRGTEKFVWSEPDPPQLYDLATDPDDRTNHHQPVIDASQQNMRNHLDLNEVEAGRRI